jgi:hypothetical protein
MLVCLGPLDCPQAFTPRMSLCPAFDQERVECFRRWVDDWETVSLDGARDMRCPPLDFSSAFRYLPALPTECPTANAIGRPWYVYTMDTPIRLQAGPAGRGGSASPNLSETARPPGASPGVN